MEDSMRPLTKVTQNQAAEKPLQGLSIDEAAQRLKRDGFNQLPKPNQRNFFRILTDILKEPMFALLMAGGAIYWLLGDHTEAFLLLLFATFSISITLVQESRSERVLDALRDLASPRALVIRSGERIHIAGKDVVRGDVLVVNEGDRIAADAHLVNGHDLLLDESLLTGESVPVNKLPQAEPDSSKPAVPGGENSPAIFAGTLVVRGTGHALVTGTGLHTEISSTLPLKVALPLSTSTVISWARK